jgi:SAM-dependent methyltransferase
MTTCYLCGSKKLRLVRRRLRYDVKRDVLKCMRCELVFLKPNKRNLTQYYTSDYRKKHSPVIGKALTSRQIFDLYAPLQGSRIERVRQYLGKDKRVLDIGCSSGHFLYNVKPFVKDCVGIEFNVANTRFTNRILGIKAYTEPIERTDLPEKYFDAIFCLQTLEHIDNPVDFLETLKPYLKGGGMVYIEVPNLHESTLSIYHNHAYEDFYYREPHLFYYTPRTLMALMVKAGYKGDVFPFQWYNFINQMHWLLTGAPQKSGFDGLREPVLIEERDKTVPPKIKREFNAWIQRIDREWKAMLEKHTLSDQIVFVGKPEK